MAPPKQSDILAISGSRAAVDPTGRLIYRTALSEPPRTVPPGPGTFVTKGPDSAAIVRADFDRRAVDTLTRVRIKMPEALYVTRSPAGLMTAKVVTYPLTPIDDWDVLPDGIIAVVRGSDYHVDWIDAKGSLRSSPRMPFDWLRLSDEDKRRIADSARNLAEERIRASAVGPRIPGRSLTAGASVSGSFAINPTEGSNTFAMRDAVVESAPLGEIPDYYPPLRAGAVRADLDGNLWILPTTSARAHGGAIVYDVVNRRGELYERVQPPPGRSIAGFGPKGVVYIVWRDSAESWHLEKNRVIR
jgi:hypothetical protein